MKRLSCPINGLRDISEFQYLGPLRATDIFIKYIYDAAFEQLRMGYASAMATLLFIVVAALALIFTPPRASPGAAR